MKNFLYFLACYLLANSLKAQPSIQWSKVIGGSKTETAWSILEASGGGYLLTGITSSNDGDISGNGGHFDAYIAKLNNLGAVEWQQVLGGSENEYANHALETTDGGFIVVGYASSLDGEVPVTNGSTDGLIIKFSSTGNIEWQRIIGGSAYDVFLRITKSPDGGYILIGTTDSTDGDVTENNGGTDCWLVKIDESGNLEWQKTYGGSKDEVGLSIEASPDGGYIVGSDTKSDDGDVTGYHPNSLDLNAPDFWIIKTDDAGEIQWQKALGGSRDDVMQGVILSKGGGYMAIGTTNSIDGDVFENYGKSDIWLVKLDSDGALNWQKNYGDIGYENISSGLVSEDDGYVFCARFTGMVTFGLCKIDESGALQWQVFFGGDICYDVKIASDKGYILAGYSSFVQPDVPVNYGNSDILIHKLSPQAVRVDDPKNARLLLFPNPASHQVTINIPSEGPDMFVRIFNVLGQSILQQNIQNGDGIDISTLPNAVYSIQVTTLEGTTYSTTLYKTE
jgi:hypothetical protein